MAPLLPSKPKASGEECLFENRPVYRCNCWHLRSDSDNCQASLNGHPGRTHPRSLPQYVATFVENVFQSAHVRRGDQENMHGFVQSLSRLLWAWPGTHDIQWHCKSDVLISLF